MRVWSAVTDGGATAGNEWREHATVENGFVRPQESGEPPKVLQRTLHYTVRMKDAQTQTDYEMNEMDKLIEELDRILSGVSIGVKRKEPEPVLNPEDDIDDEDIDELTWRVDDILKEQIDDLIDESPRPEKTRDVLEDKYVWAEFVDRVVSKMMEHKIAKRRKTEDGDDMRQVVWEAASAVAWAM